MNPDQESWKILFGHALALIDDVLQFGTRNLHWTFGGGTVLMLRHRHRLSKDIDIFVPDPQALGYVTPRLSSRAEEMTPYFQEAANFVKLFLPEGEIDFVASSHLTAHPYVVEELLGRQVKLETSAEILAKKFWHRGDRLTARDIFDFAMLSELDEHSLGSAAMFVVRHRDAILEQLERNEAGLRAQFDGIVMLDYEPTYDRAAQVLRERLCGM